MRLHGLSHRSPWVLKSATQLRQVSTRSAVHQQRQFKLLVPALQSFQRLKGHCAVPMRFTVPSSHDPDARLWPQELHGMKLGTTISRFLKACASAKKPSRRRALDDVKSQFVTLLGLGDVDDWKRFLWDQVTLPALQTYKAQYGDLLVPVSLTVPHEDDSWPRETWGYKLGFWTSELRRSKDKLLQYQLEDLETLEFSWNAREARWNRFFIPSMQRYQELHGNGQVPQNFVVPSDDPQWPAELRGYRLGQKVNNLRCGDPLGTGPDAQEMELIYKNWMLLETLHEVEGSSVLGDDEDLDQELQK